MLPSIIDLKSLTMLELANSLGRAIGVDIDQQPADEY